MTLEALITHGMVQNAVKQVSDGASNDTAASGLNWRSYSEKEFARLRAENRVVFINFTGPNSATCVVNERAVLNSKVNKLLFDELNVVTLKVEKGKIPGSFQEKLSELGNPHGVVPFYAIYGPEQDDPITLEALITRKMVQDAINAVSGTEEVAQPVVASAQ